MFKEFNIKETMYIIFSSIYYYKIHINVDKKLIPFI